MAQQRRRPNTMVYGNLAYDLDTLASQRQLEEAARPERQSQPQQAPRHRTAARPRQRVSPLVLCAVGALAAMAVVLVMGYIQLTAVTGSISDLQEQVSQLEDQRVSLVMDYERTFDMAKIKGGRRGGGHEEAHRRTGGIRGAGRRQQGRGLSGRERQPAEPADPQREKRHRGAGGIFPLSDAI